MNKFFSFSINDPFCFLQNLGKLSADQEGSAFLYSGGAYDSAQSSFFFLFPEQKISLDSKFKNPWEYLRSQFDFLDNKSTIPEWVGFFSYELGYTSDRDVKINGVYSPQFPLALFYKAGCVIKICHRTLRAEIYFSEKTPLEIKQKSFWEPFLNKSIDDSFITPEIITFQSSDELKGYKDKIHRVKEWILNGDVYQINLSQEFTLLTKNPVDPFSLYIQLLKINPPPFSAFMQCENFTVVSTSPERFLKKEGRHLETRPIKGTMPRGKTLIQDEELRLQLKNSSKERAELLMITDLMRNDLSRVSNPGSVMTKEIWRVEEYANVFHLISIIEGHAKDNIHPIDIIRDLFPGGSITGCPKLKAMELIALLEKRARRIYTGSIGYFTQNGNFDFNIAIRTLLLKDNEITIQLGGGIVLDSDPEKEFEETLHKGQSLFKVLGMRELIL